MAKLDWRWRCDVCGDWVLEPAHGEVLWSEPHASGSGPGRAAIVHHSNSGQSCTDDASVKALPKSFSLHSVYGGSAADPGVAAGFVLDVMRFVGRVEGVRLALRVLVRGFDEALPNYDRFAEWNGDPRWEEEHSRVTPAKCEQVVEWSNQNPAD